MPYDTFKNITLQQLEALIQLVDAGSFTRAADRMFLTQPTLTKHIKNLEDAVGTQIINRATKGLSLTPEGQILYNYAKRMIRLRDEAKEKILEIRDHEAGHIFLCASTIPSTYILPRLMGQMRKQYPDIRVHLQTCDSEETQQLVVNGQVELGVIGKEPFDKRLCSEELWKDELVLIAPAGYRLDSQKEPVAMEQLLKEPFVVRERGSGTRENIEGYLQKEHHLPISAFNIVGEMGSSEAVKEAVIGGLGLSIISLYAVERELKQGVLSVVPLAGGKISRHFYLIYRKHLHLLNYHRRFLEVLKTSVTNSAS
jgi:DNA-binding transcriptional LysR family regulator